MCVCVCVLLWKLLSFFSLLWVSTEMDQSMLSAMASPLHVGVTVKCSLSPTIYLTHLITPLSSFLSALVPNCWEKLTALLKLCVVFSILNLIISMRTHFHAPTHYTAYETVCVCVHCAYQLSHLTLIGTHSPQSCGSNLYLYSQFLLCSSFFQIDFFRRAADW